MLTLGPIKYSTRNNKAYLKVSCSCTEKPERPNSSDTPVTTVVSPEKTFDIFIETEEAYGRYFVTDRLDAFVVGILMKAMLDGHDIKCEAPVSGNLKFMLENQLTATLAANDPRLYRTKIIAPTIDTPIEKQEKGVGTGLSLGLDSFDTIIDALAQDDANLKLTHLFTFMGGTLGGYFKNNNWRHCAKMINEKIQRTADELGLPLVSMNTNLPRLYSIRLDYYLTYLSIMLVLSMGKLISLYYYSAAYDLSFYDVKNTAMDTCETYDLLTVYCCSMPEGVKFVLGGAEKTRLQKLENVAKVPKARDNLLSCLTEHYNCMICQKCRRNLVSLDALGLLDEFGRAYDISYYRENRMNYLRWLCATVKDASPKSRFLEPVYEMLKAREPELIKQCDDEFANPYSMLERELQQKTGYRDMAHVFRVLLNNPRWEKTLASWFKKKGISHIICYGHNEITVLLSQHQKELGIALDYVVQNIDPGKKTKTPRLPENTIDYPPCDAVIIALHNDYVVRRKLDGIVEAPVYSFYEIYAELFEPRRKKDCAN